MWNFKRKYRKTKKLCWFKKSRNLRSQLLRSLATSPSFAYYRQSLLIPSPLWELAVLIVGGTGHSNMNETFDRLPDLFNLQHDGGVTAPEGVIVIFSWLLNFLMSVLLSSTYLLYSRQTNPEIFYLRNWLAIISTYEDLGDYPRERQYNWPFLRLFPDLLVEYIEVFVNKKPNPYGKCFN